jgi:hypothetical protein
MVITRTTDITTVSKAIQQYADGIVGLDLGEWLSNNNNVALVDEDGNVCLFERECKASLVTGHFFFYKRGKEALLLSKEMLKEIFSGPYSVETITGLTPMGNLGALWLSKKIGFKPNGIIKTVVGPCQLFILTKQERTNKV